MSELPPGVLFLVGAAILPLVPRGWRSGFAVALSAASWTHHCLFLTVGTRIDVPFLGYQLTPIHVDELNSVWGGVFHLAAIIGFLYSWHVRDLLQQIAALCYVGSALGAVFAGDLLTLFAYWELTGIASVFLIWAARTPSSRGAGMRYLVVQVASGVLLLSGAILYFSNTGSLSFTTPFFHSLPEATGLFRGLASIDTFLIFTAFGIKAAFPILHSWVVDAYPESTATALA